MLCGLLTERCGSLFPEGGGQVRYRKDERGSGRRSFDWVLCFSRVMRARLGTPRSYLFPDRTTAVWCTWWRVLVCGSFISFEEKMGKFIRVVVVVVVVADSSSRERS